MNHPSKQAIRGYWCKPLLKLLHNNLGYKLTYLGLPASEAYDILCWLDYINYIIAFQCRDYPNSSSVEQSRKEVEKLEEKLLSWERQGKIDNFALYDGYIEEVLIKGKDTTGKDFLQDRSVTIYNLDFCNSITVPLLYYDEKNNKKEAYKSEAIRKLLEVQRDISMEENGSKFLMFLTVHSNFFKEESSRFIQELDTQLKKYAIKIQKLPTPEKNLRLLKLYIYKMLKSFFCTLGFTPEFLPAIYYKGADSGGQENWLLHFTIVGVQNRNPSSIAPCLQPDTTFLDQKLLNINNNRFCSRNTDGIIENNANGSSVSAFNNSYVFKELWH